MSKATSFFVLSKRSGLALDINRMSTDPLAPLIQYPIHLCDNQRFVQEYVDSEWFYLVNVNSNLVLDVNRASTKNGTLVIQYWRTGAANQLWKLEPHPIGQNCVYIVSKQSGKVLDIPCKAASSCNVRIWERQAETNQAFSLLQHNVPTTPASLTTPSQPRRQEDADPYCCITCMDNTRDCVFRPCGHCCCCKACAARIKNTSHNRCPICKATITKVEDIFLS